MDSWGVSFYKLFHMSTSHVSYYSYCCTTKIAQTISLAKVHTRLTQSREINNGHKIAMTASWGTVCWLSTPRVQIDQWGATPLQLPLPVEVISQRELPVCGQQKYYFRGLVYKSITCERNPHCCSAMPVKQKAEVFAETSCCTAKKSKSSVPFAGSVARKKTSRYLILNDVMR